MKPDAVLAPYRRAGVLMDTNLLLLYLVGAFDPEEVPRFKRTSQFTPADFALLVRFLELFQRIVTTPHVLTEAGNLAGQLADHLRRGASRHASPSLTWCRIHIARSARIPESPRGTVLAGAVGRACVRAIRFVS